MKKIINLFFLISVCVLCGCSNSDIPDNYEGKSQKTTKKEDNLTSQNNEMVFYNDISNVNITDRDVSDIHAMGGTAVNDPNFINEREKNSRAYEEEQRQVEYEKQNSKLQFDNNPNKNLSEEEINTRTQIWANVYNSPVWEKFTQTEYYKDNIEWCFVDKGEYISITGNNESLMIEIAYDSNDNSVFITITDLNTMAVTNIY